jgi:hypothetical protein
MLEHSHNLSSSGQSDNQVIKYLTQEKFRLNLPFILTHDKLLVIGMPYLKTENWLADSKTEAVRLLDVWDSAGILYLKIQNLTTLKVDILSWNLEFKDGFWLWCLTDLHTASQS